MLSQYLIDNEFATLVYHPDSRIIHHKFHQPVPGEEFRRVLQTGIDVLYANKATKWLSDDRELGVLSQEDLDWSMTMWFPKAKAAGWLHWAIVVYPEFLSSLNLEEYVTSYHKQGIRIMLFTDPDPAMRWLEAQ